MKTLLVYIVGLLFVLTCESSRVRKHRKYEGGDYGGKSKLPRQLKLGAAIDGYQCEGGYQEGGRGLSISDEWTRQNPAVVEDFTNAQVSADSYDKWLNDANVLSETHAQEYYLTIQWSRILPTGEMNNTNRAGIDYYNGIIDELTSRGIKVILRLCRVELPLPLSFMGGWANEIMVTYFGWYADVVFREFGDRVKCFVTFNEVLYLCNTIYSSGLVEPVIEPRRNQDARYQCIVNTLKAHTVAYEIYQQKYKERFGGDGKVGICVDVFWYYSETNNTEDLEIALAFDIDLIATPLLTAEGNLPYKYREQIAHVSRLQGLKESRCPIIPPEWIDRMSGACDFMGITYFSPSLVKHQDNITSYDDKTNPFDPNSELIYYNDPKWPKGGDESITWYAPGLRSMLTYIDRKFGRPVVKVMECGWSDHGEINDVDRKAYLFDHLNEVVKAIKYDGANVHSFSVYSLIDCWEYDKGNKYPYGLCHVDRNDNNFTRTLKESGKWYGRVAESRILQLD